MGMDVGASTGIKGQSKPEMNVTPLVDVVLVLLIIFMTVTPLLAKQFWVNLPDVPDPDEQSPPPPPDSEGPIVLSVSKDGDVRLNKEVVCDGIDQESLPEACRQRLYSKVTGFLRARGTRTLFFDAADKAKFGRAMQAMDVARDAGAKTIAVATEPLAGVND